MYSKANQNTVKYNQKYGQITVKARKKMKEVDTEILMQC